MDKIPFEDGVKLKNATVTINEQEYEVTPAQYQGTTPVSAFNLNKMQDNIENAIEKVIKGDIIERNQNITFTTVDITQHGKIVNIILELDCTNISLTNGQILIGKLSGVAKRKDWVRYGMFLGNAVFNYQGIGRIAINPDTGEIFIEDNNGVGQKTVIFSYCYIVE